MHTLYDYIIRFCNHIIYLTVIITLSGGVAGVTSPCGRHLALMPHPERCVVTWQWPHLAPPLPTKPGAQARLTAPWAKLFQNAFDWCLENRE